MASEEQSGIIKAATNEWVLMLFRGSSAVFLLIITLFVTGTREDVRTINREMAEFKLAYAERIAKVEGQVGMLTGSVEAHRVRITGNDNDIRAIWNRLYEAAVRPFPPATGNTRGNP